MTCQCWPSDSRHSCNPIPIRYPLAVIKLSLAMIVCLCLLRAKGTPALAIAPVAAEAAPLRLPTLFLIGDSTVNNGTRGLQGWGTALPSYFDLTKISVVNRARGGRSSRTFLTEGLWAKVLADLKPGDYVLMQFGHNDGGSVNTGYRASLKGDTDETQEVVNKTTGKPEIVHSYGWYLRQYIAGAKATGATPIVLSPVPRNIWNGGKVARATKDYGLWAAAAARTEGVAFVDLNGIIAKHYEDLGEAKVKQYFPQDHTHTNPDGAKLNAAAVAEGLKGLKDCPLIAYLAPPLASPVEKTDAK